MQNRKRNPQRSFQWNIARRTIASGYLRRHYPIMPSQPNAFPRHDDIFQKRFCNVHYRTMQDAKWGKGALRPKNPERAAAKLMGALSDEGLISHTRDKLSRDLQEVLATDLRTSLYGGEDAARYSHSSISWTSGLGISTIECVALLTRPERTML